MPAIMGVDFSGAANAGRGIWLAYAKPDGDHLRVETLQSAADLPNSARARDIALSSLRQSIAARGDCVVGLDFPLSLPLEVTGGQSWLALVSGFAATHASAEDFQATMKRLGGGRELRRACETTASVPFAAYNLRLYKQTYYGLRDLIAPLVTARQAVVLPMQRPLPGRPALIEICPASTLQRLGLYSAYKGRADSLRNHRAALLAALSQYGMVIAPDIHSIALANTGGDALDSLIATYATWNAWRTGALAAPPDNRELAEGRIYF